MPEEVPVWERPSHEPSGGVAVVARFVFAEQPLEFGPISRSKYGLPSSFDWGQLDINQHLRENAPEWFDGFFTPEAMVMAKLDMGAAADELSKMTAVYSVRIETAEPPDLAYLQGSWSAVKWLCDCGGRFVQDACKMAWQSSEHVLALDPYRGFDLAEEVRIVFETDTTEGVGHLTHTRGLAKFGRPDILLLGVTPEIANVGGVLLNGLAQRAALGAAFRPGQSVGPNGLPLRTLERYEPGQRHPQVHLNNEGLVLDVSGWGLERFV